MISDNIQHKESKIAGDFTKWFKKEKNYTELYEDTDTSGGDPFDSVGMIENELYLIEFKSQISKSMVFYKNSKGSSIEKKIGQVLQQVYKRQNTNIYNSVSEHYTNSTVPNLIIVAEKISENAHQLLSNMLEKRSNEWQFNYSVIKWEKGNANYLLNKRHSSFLSLSSNASIEIPNFPSTSPKRNPNLNYEKVREKLSTIGKLEEYNLFIDYTTSIKANLVYNINCINIKLAEKAVIGIWPFESDAKNGLRMAFEIDKVCELINKKITSFEDLGIPRSKQKLGYLGYNGYVRDITAMENLIERMKNNY